jgi:hypothetical protein
MTKTNASELIAEYLRLGGRRNAIADDNLISTRLWENEPEEARHFWETNVAPLPEHRRKEVESLLPSISGDTP